jgi:4-hydroxybenzoate polyprenyltransferase
VTKPIVRWLALLRLVRWYNVALTLIAQYICAIWVFDPKRSLDFFLEDYRLHLIVFCTSLIIAGGFIINSFYDVERDAVNHPDRLQIQKHINRDFALRIYLWLNLAALLISALTGIKVFIFMAFFAGALWFYSHKLQRIPFVREVAASLLTVTAIVSVALHYQQYDLWLLVYGFYFMMILFMRELVKDLVSQRGNVIFGYTTLSVWFGEQRTIRLLALILLFSFIPVYILYAHSMNQVFRIILLTTAALSAGAVLWEFFDFDRLRYIHANMLMRAVVILLIFNLIFLY